ERELGEKRRDGTGRDLRSAIDPGVEVRTEGVAIGIFVLGEIFFAKNLATQNRESLCQRFGGAGNVGRGRRRLAGSLVGLRRPGGVLRWLCRLPRVGNPHGTSPRCEGEGEDEEVF